MTHRRLLFWIFIGSVVLLLAVWGSSLIRQRGVSIRGPGREHGISISRGSIIAILRTHERVTSPHHSIAFSRGPVQWRNLRSFGEWDWRRSNGSFTIRPSTPGGASPGPPVATIATVHRELKTPLWAWWLVFVSVAYMVCRWMEKRAASGKDKTLTGDVAPEKSRASLAMTHRRLFRILLLASTLVTGVRWARSLHESPRFTLSPAAVPFTVLARVKQGTVMMEWHSVKGLPPRQIYDSLRTGPERKWMGRFGLERIHERPRSGPPFTIIRVDFPLWLPWLLFNGGAFVLLRMLERRSTRGKEKELAEGKAADRVAGDPV